MPHPHCLAGRSGIACALLALLLLVTQNTVARPTLYVARRGWHVDIGVPTRELAPPLNFIAAEFPGAQFVFFGFGDRRYLLARHRHGAVLLEALWPGPGLLLVTALSAPPSDAFGATHVAELPVSGAESAAAQNFIRRSFGGSAASIDPVAAGPYEGSLFYPARSRYSAVHTCNTWVAEALQAAGLPLRPHSVVFAGQLWRRVEKISAKRRTASREE